jgi:hypothetical protein
MHTQYNFHRDKLCQLLKRKLQLAIVIRSKWPLFATFAEDKASRGSYWDHKFADLPNIRPIIHDCKDYPFMKPSNADLHRLLYSIYYARCVEKLGISTQVCGWIVTLEAYVGAIGDSRYIEDTKC